MNMSMISSLREASDYQDFVRRVKEYQEENPSEKTNEAESDNFLGRFLNLNSQTIKLQNGSLFMLRGVLDSLHDLQRVEGEIKYLTDLTMSSKHTEHSPQSIQSAIAIASLFSLLRVVDGEKAIQLCKHVTSFLTTPSTHAAAANIVFVLMGSCSSQFDVSKMDNSCTRYVLRDNMLLCTAVITTFSVGSLFRDTIMTHVADKMQNYTSITPEYFPQLIIKCIATQISRGLDADSIAESMQYYIPRVLEPSFVNTLVNSALKTTQPKATQIIHELIFGEESFNDAEETEYIQSIPFDTFEPWVQATDERIETVQSLAAGKRLYLPPMSFQTAALQHSQNVRFDRWFLGLEWVGKPEQQSCVESMQTINEEEEKEYAIALAARLLVEGYCDIAVRYLGKSVVVQTLQQYPQIIWIGGLFDKKSKLDSDSTEIHDLILLYEQNAKEKDQVPRTWPLKWTDDMVDLVVNYLYRNDPFLGCLPIGTVPVYSDERFLFQILPLVCTTHVSSGWWSMLYEHIQKEFGVDADQKWEKIMETYMPLLAIKQLPFFIYASKKWTSPDSSGATPTWLQVAKLRYRAYEATTKLA